MIGIELTVKHPIGIQAARAAGHAHLVTGTVNSFLPNNSHQDIVSCNRVRMLMILVFIQLWD